MTVAIDELPHSVSVVVATRNDRPFIRDCIDSLLGQDVPIDELIVLDCGSTDGTPEVVAAVTGVRLVRDVAPDDAVDLGRTLAVGDVVCVATGRARYGKSAIRDSLGPAAGRASAEGLVPVGTTSFGRAAAAVARWLPIAPPALTCWWPSDSIGRRHDVHCWNYVPATPSALARECYRAGANRAVDPRTALPALLVVASGVAAARHGRRFGRVAVPVAHGLACALLAARSGRDPGVAPHRAFAALEIGHWSTGVGFWRGLVRAGRWRRSS